MGLKEKLSLQGPSRGTQNMRCPEEIIGPPCFKGKQTLILGLQLGGGLEAENLTLLKECCLKFSKKKRRADYCAVTLIS